MKECIDLNQASAISCSNLDLHVDFSDGHSIDLRAEDQHDLQRWESALRGKRASIDGVRLVLLPYLSQHSPESAGCVEVNGSQNQFFANRKLSSSSVVPSVVLEGMFLCVQLEM